MYVYIYIYSGEQNQQLCIMPLSEHGGLTANLWKLSWKTRGYAVVLLDWIQSSGSEVSLEIWGYPLVK